MKSVLVAFGILLFVSPALAGDSTHPFKNHKGKMIDLPWWETMATCYGRLHALSEYAGQSNAQAAEKLKGYSDIALKLALNRLTEERGISVEEAQQVILPNARSAAEITNQGFAIYKMNGTIDDKNNELINNCFTDFNAYAKQFPGELNGAN